MILKILVATITTMGFSCPANAQDAGAAAARLKEIHRTVMDPQQVFSIRVTLAELEKLKQDIPASDIEAQGEFHYLQAFVLYRAGKMAEALPHSLEALRIDDKKPFLTAYERSRFIYSIARQAEDTGQWGTAIEHYRRAIPLFDADPEFDEDQRLGARERLGFCLHEAGQYQEALTLNREILAKGEKLFGPDSEKLLVVITNLSQNTYMLGQADESRRFLERRLAIATKHDDQNHVDDSLFQLGVLAFEQGHPDEAEKWMKRRLDLARKSGDDDRIDKAEEDLQILYKKMGRS
ncbi:MAG: tetratricopeptide repeat protein [Pseudomonadota bacterium]|nr:tetratricopeptide repeat protein [Pseudomonadota bacterium]